MVNPMRMQDMMLMRLLLCAITSMQIVDVRAWADPPATLEDLCLTYRKFGLPIPPDDAKLVRFVIGKESTGAPGYRLGFLINMPDNSEQVIVLSATKYHRGLRRQRVVAVEPIPMALNQVRPMGMDALAIAVQCKDRGWDDLANKLVEMSSANNSISLSVLAFNYWTEKLLEKGSDRGEILMRWKTILSSKPMLSSERYSSLVRSLELALVPSKAKAGSVEALIDDLLKIPTDSPAEDGVPRRDSRYRRLIQRGFEAIPVLIEHLNDDRLTLIDPPNSLRTVREVSESILRGMAGHDLDDGGLDRAVVLAWWKKARGLGEERYLVAHALSAESDNEWPNQEILWLLSKKYPSSLAKLYLSVLNERPQMESWPIVEAIMDASFPRETKVALLVQATKNANFEHRRAALWQLKDLDYGRFTTALIESVEAIPKTPSKPYWESPEASLAQLVLQTDDPRAWQSLLTAAKRADVGLRMQMIGNMRYGRWRSKVECGLFREFLINFFSDDMVVDAKAKPEMFEGPHAGFEFPRLEVRDLAAMAMAGTFCLDIYPRVDWSGEQWAGLREQVRKAFEEDKKTAQPGC